MPWTTTPPGGRRSAYGWSTNPAPIAPPVQRGPGWFVSLHELAAAASISVADAGLVVRTVAEARGISLPDAALLVHMTAQASSLSSATAAVVEHLFADAPAASVSTPAALVVPQLVAQALGVSFDAAVLVLKAGAAASSASNGVAANAFPAMAPLPQQFATAGNYTYTIPYWCRFIDIVVLGGGGGGQASAALFNYGAPGEPGEWRSVTIERGVDIPWALASITGSVGNGGAGGIGPSILPGAWGDATTANYGSTLSAPGGSGGIGWAGSQALSRGKSPGNFTHNGQLYTGGAAVTGNNQPGNPPGGSGSGSAQFSSGSNGARGAVWFRAYQ
ncbi:minor tail protein [Mycobacterium phage Milly]|uniref:minor tail protein n=1 Tax=Mycobacterium phage Milly TaxID=1567473 RepID=UPI000572A86A|nr:minor tail protein [Mycobacterium phage Milly]AJA43698.1 minor tail protein [Mycobacterium phage Milly]